MKVREIMNRRVCQISSSAMLNEAIDRMRALGADTLPVVENHRIVGVVTEGDIASRARARDVDPRTTPVRNVTKPDAVCCSQDDDVEKAVDLVETSHVRRLIALDAQGAAVGVLSQEDLASKVGGHSRESH